MAPGVPKQLGVRLPENEEVARLLLEKHRSMLEKGLTDNLSLTLSTAYRNVCGAKEHIRTLKDLLKIKGVGPWVIRLVKESFPESSPDLSPPKIKAKGKKGKKTKRSEHSPDFVCSSSANMASQELIQLMSQEQIGCSSEVQTTSNSSGNVILSDSDSDEPYKGNNPLIGNGRTSNFGASDCSVSIPPLSSQGTSELQPSSTPYPGSAEFTSLDKDNDGLSNSILAMPPRLCNEKFLEAYEVVLVLDDRETFGSHGMRVVSNIHSKFRVPVEIKRLPVGDGIWIARHRRSRTEYVLDFIVERKGVTDLVSSIRDSRYKDQKLRLKFFHWLADLDRCWSADRLARRGLPHHTACPLCNQEPETMHHLIIGCPFARQVWHEVIAWLRLPCSAPSRDTASLLDWWHDARQHAPKPMRKGLASMALLIPWMVWKQRND